MSSAPRGAQKHYNSGSTKSDGVELGKSGASAKGTGSSANPSAPTSRNANTIVAGESSRAISNNQNNLRVTTAQSAAVEAKSPYVSRGQGDSPVAGKQRSKTQNLRRGQSQPTAGQVPQLSLGETYLLTTGQTSQLTQGQPSQSTQEQPSQLAQGQNPQHNQEQSHQTPQGTGGQNPPANPTQGTRPRAQTATSGTTAES